MTDISGVLYALPGILHLASSLRLDLSRRPSVPLRQLPGVSVTLEHCWLVSRPITLSPPPLRRGCSDERGGLPPRVLYVDVEEWIL